MRNLKIVFCWSAISGYFAASWAALAKYPDMDVFVIAESPVDSTYNDALVKGIPHRLVDRRELRSRRLIAAIVCQEQPDVIVLAGWMFPAYRALTSHPDLKRCKFILFMDGPWLGSFRQRVATWLLRPFIGKISMIFVPGERARQYAVRLVMGRDIRIETGMYAMDRGLFAPIAEKRLSKQWPKQFLFIGQHTRRKGVDILIKAYTKYRQSVRDPWPLLTCGQGPLGKALESTEGIINKGFLQPAELPVVMLESGVFILPSRYEPWGVVLTEACVSGLPVIATSECGSGEAVLRDGENGLMVRPGDSNALCACMIRMHEDYLRLPAMGRKSVSLAERYSAEAWAKKIREGVNKLLR